MQGPILDLGSLIGGAGGSIFIFVLVFFLPTIVGFNRADIRLIFFVNLLAGWSIIGWFAALFLAFRTTITQNPFSSSPTSVADEIAKLRELRNQGVITQQEFEHLKNNLLS